MPLDPGVPRVLTQRPGVDNAIVKALARAFWWRQMLDAGLHATLEDLGRAKDATYVSRILRLPGAAIGARLPGVATGWKWA